MKILALCSICICLAGCASQRTFTAPPLPTLGVPHDADSIRYQETFRAYQVGRYVEPNNPLVMHDTHTLYRVETLPHWNLYPSAPSGPMPVQVRAIPDPAHAQAPLNDEIVAELNQQKEITQKVTSEANRLTSLLEQLSGSLAETKAVAKQNLTVKQQLLGAEQRISALEIELRRLGNPATTGVTNVISEPEP
jgi:hypothetical protein